MEPGCRVSEEEEANGVAGERKDGVAGFPGVGYMSAALRVAVSKAGLFKVVASVELGTRQ